MSIYPVRAKTWWVNHNDTPKEMQEEIRLEREIIKGLIKRKSIKCLRCGKPVTNWNTCYISHAFVYGYNDAYCNKKCYIGKGATQ